MPGGDAEHPVGPGDVFGGGELQQVAEQFCVPRPAAVTVIQQFFQIQEEDLAVPGGGDVHHHRDAAEGVGLGEGFPCGNVVEDDAVPPQVDVFDMQFPGQEDAERSCLIAGAGLSRTVTSGCSPGPQVRYILLP